MLRQANSGPEKQQAGVGPKVPLLPGLNQHSAHLGQATLPVAQGGSLAGCSPELVAKGIIGPILLREQAWHIMPLLLVPGIQSGQPTRSSIISFQLKIDGQVLVPTQ